MKDFRSETSMLEQIKTKVVATPMAMAFTTEFVTASTGHMPNSMTNTGF